MSTLTARSRPATFEAIRVDDEPKDVCDWVASKTGGLVDVGYDDDGTITLPGQRAAAGDYLVWFGGRTIGAFTAAEFAEHFEVEPDVSGLTPRELEIYQMLDAQLRGEWASQNNGDDSRSTEPYEPFFVLEISDNDGQDWSIHTRWYRDGGWGNFRPADPSKHTEVWSFTGDGWDDDALALIQEQFHELPGHQTTIDGAPSLDYGEGEIAFLAVAPHNHRPSIPIEMARLLAWAEGLYKMERESADADA